MFDIQQMAARVTAVEIIPQAPDRVHLNRIATEMRQIFGRLARTESIRPV